MADGNDRTEGMSLGEGLEASESPLIYDEEEPNLIPVFAEHPDGEDALKEIEERVFGDFEADWAASKDTRERRAENWKLFAGELTEKDFPWEDCANGHVPITLENVSRLAARVYAEILGSTRNIFGVLPVGPDDEELARLLTHHGNWQIRNQIPDFFNQQHRGILMFFLWGDVVCHSTYDLDRQQNHHEMLTCDEFVTPFTIISTQPDFSDLPHHTRVRYMQRHEIEREAGLWHDTASVLARTPEYSDEPETPLADSTREVNAVQLPENGTAAPYKILDYEGWLTLPNQTRQRFCRVIMDHATKRLLSVSIHEEPTWMERVRYENQTADLARYLQSKEEYAAGEEVVIAGREALEADENLLPEEKQQVLADVERENPPPPPPVAPAWMENPEDAEEKPKAMRKSPIHMYSHAVCIDNLTGSLGLGLGNILCDLNLAADTMLNQSVDAATVANAQTLLVHENIELDDPPEIAPGKMMRVGGVDMGDMQNGIMPLQRAPANPQLVEFVKMFEKWGQSAVQAPAVMSGEAGKSGETARGLTARIEQAVKQTSVAAGRYAEFLKQILKNNGRLNSIYMAAEEFFAVNDHMGTMEEMSIGRSAYSPNYSVEIVSNLKFTPQQQKQQDAEALLEAVMAIPVLTQNSAIMYDALVQFFEANEQEAMIPKLGKPPLPPEEFVPPPTEEEIAAQQASQEPVPGE